MNEMTETLPSTRRPGVSSQLKPQEVAGVWGLVQPLKMNESNSLFRKSKKCVFTSHWNKSKPGAPTWVQGPEDLGHLSVFQGMLAESWIISGASRTGTSTHMRFEHCRWQLNQLHHDNDPQLPAFRKGMIPASSVPQGQKEKTGSTTTHRENTVEIGSMHLKDSGHTGWTRKVPASCKLGKNQVLRSARRF